jgi:hypothetical protein
MSKIQTFKRGGFNLQFTNGFRVSVQIFPGSYSTAGRADMTVGAFTNGIDAASPDAEIAIIGPKGEWRTRQACAALGVGDPYDDVLGYTTADDVARFIAWAAAQEA